MPAPAQAPADPGEATRAASERPDDKAAAKPKAVVYKGDAALVTLLQSLRSALDASRKAGEDPDLTMSLLSGIAEVSLVSTIHGHYALAGTGQALRTGGMPAADVQIVARDMQRNFAQLGQTYARLAGQRSFHPQLVDIFRALQILNGKAEQTAATLATWAESSSDAMRVRAFESALEDYRGRVKALIASLPR